MNKILLVGELNPYGADPKYALYPMPKHASGARLQQILGLSNHDYLRGHDRVNLCVGEFSMPRAVDAALGIVSERLPNTGVVLCGTKVAEAFRRAGAYPKPTYAPLTLEQDPPTRLWFLAIPHPSGLNRAWNDPEVAVRTRALYDELREHVGYELKIARSA